MIKLLTSLLLVAYSTTIFASELSDKKIKGLAQLESAFALTSETMTTKTTPKIKAQPNLELQINNQWQLEFKSQQNITINKISLTIDNVTVANQVNLLIPENKTPVKYLFASDNLNQQVQITTKGYKILGLMQQLLANDYQGYEDYRYKVVRVTLTHTNNQQIYNETTTNFLLLYAK